MPETAFVCDICGASIPSALVQLHVLSHRQRGEKVRVPGYSKLDTAVFLAACFLIGVVVALIISALV